MDVNDIIFILLCIDSTKPGRGLALLLRSLIDNFRVWLPHLCLPFLKCWEPWTRLAHLPISTPFGGPFIAVSPYCIILFARIFLRFLTLAFSRIAQFTTMPTIV